MKKAIWKFHIEADETEIEVPWYTRVISCGQQNGTLVIWVLVDVEEKRKKNINVRVIMTGQEFEFAVGPTYNRFVGTVQLPRLGGEIVAHVFADDNKDGI